MQVEFLGTIATILETLRAEGVEIEEILISGIDEEGEL
jgi:hypothetical protein